MTAWIPFAALCCVAAGLVAGVLTGAAARDGQTGLGVALDFWLAGGLLNLGVEPGWQPLAVAASILVIRRLLGVSLRRPVVRPAELFRRPGLPARTRGEPDPPPGDRR